jgi:fatty-acyl-CoA synthase
MQSTMMRFPLTLPHILERGGRLFGRRAIVTRLPDKSLRRSTFADFHRRARLLASALIRAGLKRGDRVATLMWNHWAHLEAYFGIPCAGGVLHTLNLRLSPEDIAYIANHAEDRFILVDDVLLPLLEKFAGRIRPERIIVFPFSGAPVPAGYESYEDFLATGTDDFAYPELDENEAAAMCYTSGTTGRPKGVVYSHRSTVLHCFAQSMCADLIQPRDVLLPVVPMFHANAWGYPYTCVMLGAGIVFPGPHLDAESLLELAQRERVTLAAGVPTIWLGIIQQLDAHPEKWRMPPVRMLVGGSAVPESLIRAFARHGHTVTQGWGMTETSPLATLALPKPTQDGLADDDHYALAATQGVPMPFVELRGMDDDGEIAWDGKTPGEIQVRGPWITGSYHHGEDPDKFTPDGWLRTGDVATIDAEGFVRITDRTKDLIKSGGEWISSVDLENAIMSHPAVAEAAVVAVAHPKWMERPLAAVVRKPGAAVDAAEIRAHLEKKFAKWMVPDAYEFIDEIPRTSTGKFKKTALRERYRDYRWPDA